jgi:type VI secretion system secreted protein Hcp
MASSAEARGSASADVFLAIKTKRAGEIKGESAATGHENAIVVSGWTWGVASSAALGSAQATSRRSYSNLVITKRVDSASTALMSVLVTNDEVKEAKLAMRKAGEGQRDFFTITLTNARVIGVDLDCDASGEVFERVSIAFTKVQVDYELQKSSGQRGASTSFNDELLAS